MTVSLYAARLEWKHLWLASLGWLLLVSPLSLTALAEEPAEEFLTKLRDNGYFAFAETYLERMKTSSLASPSFRESIDFEQAVVLTSIALRQSDAGMRKKQLDQAKERFQSFMKRQQSHPRVADARNWLRNISLQNARQITSATRLTEATAEEVGLAKEEFDEAAKYTDAEISRLKEEITGYAKRPKNRQDSDELSELRARYVREKMIRATIAFDAAGTSAAGSSDEQKQLEKALQRFAEIAKKYRTRFEGLHAVLYQGKCRQRLGKYPEAIGLFEELLDPTDQPDPVVMVSAEAAQGKMECIAKNGNLQDAVDVGESWLASAPNPDSEARQILDLKLATGKLYMRLAKGGGANARSASSAARKYLSMVAGVASPQRSDARSLLAELPGGKEAMSGAIDMDALSNYSEAKSAAGDLRQRLQSAETLAKLLAPKIGAASGARKAEMQTELAQAKSEAQMLRQSAARLHRRAHELAPAETSQEEINELVFYRCYYGFGEGNHFESAVLGEFLAMQHSGDRYAKNAANVALASYLQLYGDGGSPHSSSLQSRLVRLADFIAATWPNDKGAQDALITLVSFMVNQGDVAAAENYLSKIPADSPRRGDAELRTGGAMWQAYARGIRENGGKTTAKLDALKERAQSTLATGIERMRASGNSPTLAQAALSLAQIYIDTEQSQKADELLRDKAMGPLTLVQKNDPSVANPAFPPLIYKTALRAQLARMAATPGAGGMNEAVKLMAGLKSAMGDTAEGKRRLISTYVGLANDLQAQLGLLQPAARKSLATGFDAFLNQVRQDADEFNVKNWIAETYFKLGESFLGPQDQVSALSQRYFANAGEVFADIVKDADAGTLQIEPNLAIQIRMRRASIMRQLGNFEQAMDEFEKILRQKNSALNVQIEAAKALQAGGMTGQAELFGRAAKGDRRNPNTGKNTIWGWERIARVVQSQMQRGPEQRKQYEKYFFQAQYNLILCRLEQGLKSTGPNKTKYIKSAARILKFTSATYPELGGAEWNAKFQKLQSRIDQATGVAAQG